MQSYTFFSWNNMILHENHGDIIEEPWTSFLEVWSLGFGGTEYEEVAYKSLIMQSCTIFSWNYMILHENYVDIVEDPWASFFGVWSLGFGRTEYEEVFAVEYEEVRLIMQVL